MVIIQLSVTFIELLFVPGTLLSPGNRAVETMDKVSVLSYFYCVIGIQYPLTIIRFFTVS